jgi:hypothetical protein
MVKVGDLVSFGDFRWMAADRSFSVFAEVDTAQYTKQSEDSDELDILYQITNSPSDLKITTDSGLNSVLTFPGCPKQGGTPNLTWSTTTSARGIRSTTAFRRRHFVP